MSTFNGVMKEFPDIRGQSPGCGSSSTPSPRQPEVTNYSVDCFVQHFGQPPPLACFLSHVHSDHLKGLASFRSPFIYCSAATREILIRIERYWCRTWNAKGILEKSQVTYKHLAPLLKPIPLDTPTKLELEPGRFLQFTLIDANHCPGSVMFLFEGDDKAVLYTGDTRSEPWFVNALTRNPSIISYTAGPKTLDKIYLDTSFLEDVPFQTKAEGIAELLRSVARYPADTIFHFQAWTYGYEDVWIALAKALDTRIHIDEYRMRIFQSLAPVAKKAGVDSIVSIRHLCPEAAALAGHMCGNTLHVGCLTTDTNVRLHSCEKGNYCSVVNTGPVVWIQPIIAHLEDGYDQVEVGVGGGGRDLEREVELGVTIVEDLMNLASSPKKLADQFWAYAANNESDGGLRLEMDVAALGSGAETADMALSKALAAIKTQQAKRRRLSVSLDDSLPQTIRFPFARHSSYRELCHLVDAFKPRDVWPCTESAHNWVDDGQTIEVLFGEHCSGNDFDYDVLLEAVKRSRETDRESSTPRSRGQSPEPSAMETPSVNGHSQLDTSPLTAKGDQETCMPEVQSGDVVFDLTALDSQVSEKSTTSRLSQLSQVSWEISHERADAYAITVHNLRGDRWEELRLVSTSGHHTNRDDDIADEFALPAAHVARHGPAHKRSRGTFQVDREQRRRLQ